MHVLLLTASEIASIGAQTMQQLQQYMSVIAIMMTTLNLIVSTLNGAAELFNAMKVNAEHYFTFIESARRKDSVSRKIRSNFFNDRMDSANDRAFRDSFRMSKPV